jgi:hypothetical protein
MSVAFTEDAVRERRKTVTRRRGWTFLKPGDHLTLCRKVMGRTKGDPLVRIAEVEVIDVRRERLDTMIYDWDYGLAEVKLEGFPELTPNTFVCRYFFEAQKLRLDAVVTRIEWRYLDDQAVPA